MSDYEATAYLSLEKLKVITQIYIYGYLYRKSTCLNLSSSKTESARNSVQR